MPAGELASLCTICTASKAMRTDGGTSKPEVRPHVPVFPGHKSRAMPDNLQGNWLYVPRRDSPFLFPLVGHLLMRELVDIAVLDHPPPHPV